MAKRSDGTSKIRIKSFRTHGDMSATNVCDFVHIQPASRPDVSHGLLLTLFRRVVMCVVHNPTEAHGKCVLPHVKSRAHPVQLEVHHSLR